MSEGLVNIAGGPTVEIALAGDVYTMSPVTLLHDAELEQHILQLKASPLEAIEKLPPLPERPKPIIKSKDETTEEYGVRHKAWQAEKDEWQRRVSQRDALIAQAFQEATKPRVVTIPDTIHFMQTTESTFFRLWLSLKPNHPEFTSVGHVKQLCSRHEQWCLANGIQENAYNIIDEKLSEAAMEQALKNFGGRENPAPSTAAAKSNQAEEFLGGESTQTSPASMDGQLTKSTS